MRRRALLLLAAAALAVAVGSAPIQAAPIAFRDAMDDSPLNVKLKPGEALTPALEQFYATGIDPYLGNAEAIAAGKALFAEFCQVCHMPDATGRIGPNLVDDVYNYKRTSTDVGMFEVLYAGAAGAMRSLADRLTQDQMLRVIAFVRSLKQK
jgi:cytochrome c-L